MRLPLAVLILLLPVSRPVLNQLQHPPGIMSDTELSAQDLAKHLYKHCNDILASERQHTHDSIKAERDHNTLKLAKVLKYNETVTNTLLNRIEKLENALINQDEIVERITNLENTLASTNKNISDSLDILEETIANVNLRANTNNIYQEELLYSLKHALFDTLTAIKIDKCCPCSQPSENNICCEFCGQTFYNETDFHRHSQLSHAGISVTVPEPANTSHHVLTTTSLQVIKCYKCDKLFQTYNDLKNHAASSHIEDTPDSPGDTPEKENCSKVYMEPDQTIIPQLDGPIEEIPDLVAHNPSTASVRTAPYILNQDKQTEKIKNDAAKHDYEVNVNNNDQNATVKCSSGFYIQVARASLGSLHSPSVLACGDIAITVDRVTVTKDKLGIEATKLLSFSFLSNQDRIAGVTVHLHHSTRTIQIQGSSVMPDSTRSALWFLKNFVLIRFKEQAKAKNYAIRSTNESILNACNNSTSKVNKRTANHDPQSSCSSCNRGFNTSSKPSKCTVCGYFFHKTNCLRDHNKTAHGSTQQSLQKPSSRGPLVSMPQNMTYLSSTPSIMTISSESSSLVSDSVLSSSQPTLSTIVSLPASRATTVTSVDTTPVPPTACRPTALITTTTANSTSSLQVIPVSTSLNVLSSSISASSVPASSAPTSTIPSSRSSKNKKPFIPISADQARIEFLQAELASAQARIVQLDSSLKEKDQRLTVLTARLKILEEEQTKSTYNKYFPSNNPEPPTIHQNQPCYQPLPCCHHNGHHYHQYQNQDGSSASSLFSLISKLDEKVDALASDTRLAFQNLHSMASPTSPPLSPSPTPQPSRSVSSPKDNSDQAHDESIASIEEFIFEDQPLNYQCLTNQQ